MIFKKKKKNPILKDYIINNEKRILKNHKHVFTLFYLVLCQAVAQNKEFGLNKREKNELYNDISIFELTSYVLYHLYNYCLTNHRDKILTYSSNLFEKGKFDLFEILKESLSNSHKDKVEWENLSKLYDDRLRFYCNTQNVFDKHYKFFTAIKSSTQFQKPINKIKEMDFLIIDSTELLKLSIQLKAYEETILPNLFEALELFFSESPEFGFREII